MATFTKATALAVLDGAGGTGKANLADKQLKAVWKLLYMFSNRKAYGSLIPLSVDKGTDLANIGSITYLTSTGSAGFVSKDGIEKHATDAKSFGINESTITTNMSIVSRAAVAYIDEMKLTSGLLADRLVSSLNELNDAIDVGFFKFLVDAIPAIVGQTMAKTDIAGQVSFKSASGDLTLTDAELKDLSNQIIHAATQLCLLKRDKNGVYGGDGVEGVVRSQIFIDLEPKIFAQFCTLFGIIAFSPPAGLNLGSFRLAQWGGYTLRENLSLEGIKNAAGNLIPAIIGTGHTAVIPWSVIAVNTGKINNSNDHEMYIEGRILASDKTKPLETIQGKVVFNTAVIFEVKK